MDLTYPPEAEAFRVEIRAWLAEHLPPGWGTDAYQPSDEERARFAEEWTSTLFEGGWICATWPVDYGGRGLSTMEAVVLNEEFASAGAPLRADFFGDTLVGPTILQWGSEEQKKAFLPAIMRGQIAWCQGFSEPDAGSDLAGLKTSAVPDGDEWRINGQKIWTSQADRADYVFLLARTDPDAPRHAGISYLLVPMDQAGVDVRPITQISGSAEFSEVFFTDARAPLDNVVGGVNNGWKVAMTTLGFERGTSATTGYRRFAKELEQIRELVQRTGRQEDPLVRQDLARAYTAVKIMEINGYRSLTGVLNADARADPALAALAATNKMFWSEYHQWVTNMAVDLRGADGQILDGQPVEGAAVAPAPGVGRTGPGRPGYQPGVLQTSFFFARSETIWGGAAQIQRNIVGERVLGLPKEPKAAGSPRG